VRRVEGGGHARRRENQTYRRVCTGENKPGSARTAVRHMHACGCCFLWRSAADVAPRRYGRHVRAHAGAHRPVREGTGATGSAWSTPRALPLGGRAGRPPSRWKCVSASSRRTRAWKAALKREMAGHVGAHMRRGMSGGKGRESGHASISWESNRAPSLRATL